MPKHFAVVLFCLLAFSTLAAQKAPIYDFPDGKEGVTEMIEYLLTASDKERKRISKSLIPLKSDYEVVFHQPFADRVFRYHKQLRRYVDIVIRPHHEVQKVFQIWVTSTAEMKAYTGEARQFPGGYKEIAHHFKDDLMLYRFKFMFPGMRRGSSFDVLVYVNGHWRLFPRPWMVSDELKGN